MIPLTFQVVKRVHLSPLALNEKLESVAPAELDAVFGGRGAKKSTLGFFMAAGAALADLRLRDMIVGNSFVGRVQDALLGSYRSRAIKFRMNLFPLLISLVLSPPSTRSPSYQQAFRTANNSHAYSSSSGYAWNAAPEDIPPRRY
jgi:hypothetical protein